MSRFLIRSCISCKNLASRVLGLAIRMFPEDFENRYGHRPLLLESFVDITHYKGTCYKAANRQWIGRTKGRGRQDRFKEYEETVKDIYAYPLEKDFRIKIGLSANCGLGALDLYAGIDNENCAENEFGGAPLGDKRLSNRLVDIGYDKAMNPGVAYSGTAGGDWPKVKAYYRLIDKPDDSAVTMSNIFKCPIKIGVINISEDTPPANTEPLEWFLLMTIVLKSIDDVLNCVKWYCLRWRIEDWHRVLKSGCGIEKIAHK